MLPLAFLMVAGGALLVVAGATGSSLASVISGHPDGANVKTPAPGAGEGAASTPAGATGGTPAGPVSLGGGSVEQQIIHFFVAKGFTPAQAAGIAGNAGQESSFNPGDAGGGLFQTIGGRGAGQGASVQAQLESAYHEMQQRGEIGGLKQTRTPQEAARYFSGSFEKPGIPNLPARERYAAEAYARYHG